MTKDKKYDGFEIAIVFKSALLTRSLLGWGYRYKARLHGLNSAHLYTETVLQYIQFNAI